VEVPVVFMDIGDLLIDDQWDRQAPGTGQSADHGSQRSRVACVFASAGTGIKYLYLSISQRDDAIFAKQSKQFGHHRSHQSRAAKAGQQWVSTTIDRSNGCVF